jgi:hypothetical protein
MARPVAPDRPITAAPIRVRSVEQSIKGSVTKQMSERLGVPANQLPAEVQTMIGTASAAAAAKAIELGVVRDVEEAAAGVSRGNLLSRFDARVDLARKGLDHISASSDVDRIMKQRANMLAAKKKALENAGFSPQEAMDIILADIAARGH